MIERQLDLEEGEFIAQIIPLRYSFIIIINVIQDNSNKILHCDSLGKIINYKNNTNCQFISSSLGIEIFSEKHIFITYGYNPELDTEEGRYPTEYWFFDENDQLQLMEKKEEFSFMSFVGYFRNKNHYVCNKDFYHKISMLPFSVIQYIYKNKNSSLHLVELNSMTPESFYLPINPDYIAISQDGMTMMLANRNKLLIMDI